MNIYYVYLNKSSTRVLSIERYMIMKMLDVQVLKGQNMRIIINKDINTHNAHNIYYRFK